MTTLLCPPAHLDFDEHGNARATDVDDIYFSADDGLAESRTVFLMGTGLPDRWQNRRRFTVAELGFGTGLNILALLELWRTHRPRDGRLHIVSVEGRPLRRDQAQIALSRWPHLSDLAQRLLSAWPPPWKGAHRRRFDDLGVTLTIFHEDAVTALEQAEFQADAWFLDGFSPAKNPQMWRPALLAQVARLSAADARAATFTVAGAVRRGLEAVGFAVEKRPGFGQKRQRLEAIYRRTPAPCGPHVLPRSNPVDGPVHIIGGGVAAAALSHALRARGRPVQLIAHRGLAAGASGGPSGLLTPRLEANDSPYLRALMAAFAFSRQLFDGWPGFYPEGVLRFAEGEEKLERLRRIAGMVGDRFEIVDAQRATALTGVEEAPAGIFMHDAGRFTPERLVRGLAGDVSVLDAKVHRIERIDDRWQLFDADGRRIDDARCLVIAGGAHMTALLDGQELEIRKTGGSVLLREQGKTSPLRAPMAWGGYVSATGPHVLLGATHEPNGVPTSEEEAEAFLRARLERVCPMYAANLGPTVGAWASVRATTKDRLPLVGPLGPGLSILGGFGGRGFAHAPLLAEMLASDLEGEPAALERGGLEAFHPERFALRRRRSTR
ncbi:MAG: tRNA (5-methylaminomethyl-2-thiouridine)(34)-methyltransferase MnmD [Myxococcota bacterium]